MKRWLCTQERVRVDQPTLEDMLPHVRELLQAGTGSESARPAGDGSFALRVPSAAFGVEVAKRVAVSLGTVRRAGSRLVLPITWRALPAGRLFPVFDGTLEFEPLDDHRTQLTLVGTSTPPLGPVGAAVDAALLHTVAERTAQRLLQALCREFETASRVPRVDLLGSDDVAMLVSDAMTGHPVVVDEDTSIRTAALLMHHGGISGLPVVDDDGVLVGVLTEADLLPHVAPGRWAIGRQATKERTRRAAHTVGEACSRPARCTAPDARLSAAAREMLDRDTSRLVVIEGGRVVGILTRHDVLTALIRSDGSLRGCVEAVLHRAGHDRVTAEVTSARAQLTGRVERRSSIDELPALLGTVDGLEGVDVSGVDWQVDDTTQFEPMTIT